MLMKVYSVFDRKMREFGQLVYGRTDEAVIRAFADSLNRGRSPVADHPEDYELMYLGEFDAETGRLSGIEGPPRHVVMAHNLILPKEGSDAES